MSDFGDIPADEARFQTGLIGRNIQLSRSPEMHMEEARALGLCLEYKLFDFAELGLNERDLPVFLKALQGSGTAGVNVTHPYKQTIIPHLDELSEGAQRIGAVNTVAFRAGRMLGFNTDATGFAESFRRGLPEARTATVFQAGAGGAGAATAHALLGLGAGQILLFDPDASRAAWLREALENGYGSGRAKVVSDLAAALAESDGIVNATPIGMAEHPGTGIPVDLLERRHWVADVVYFPIETELLRAARDKACATLDGGGMAVYQAADAFEIFTGVQPNPDRMRARFLARV